MFVYPVSDLTNNSVFNRRAELTVLSKLTAPNQQRLRPFPQSAHKAT